MTDTELKAIIEALVYVAEDPITEEALLEIFGKEMKEQIRAALVQLVAEYQAPERGIEIKEVANGYRMATKAEHHEWVRKYIKNQTAPVKLSLAALETLAVIAYKQPITVPEIQDIRGVNAVGVIKTLIDRKLITTAGRKNVIGRPILYRTTKEFLVHFGLKNTNELPSLEEFEELARMEFGAPAAEVQNAATTKQEAATLPFEETLEEPPQATELNETEAASPLPQEEPAMRVEEASVMPQKEGFDAAGMPAAEEPVEQPLEGAPEEVAEAVEAAGPTEPIEADAPNSLEQEELAMRVEEASVPVQEEERTIDATADVETPVEEELPATAAAPVEEMPLAEEAAAIDSEETCPNDFKN